MVSAVASAPGKLMLFGEHAVVYGYPCIVTAVDIRITVRASRTTGSQITISTPDLSQPFSRSIDMLATAAVDDLPAPVKFVGVALQKFWGFYGERFAVEITTGAEFQNSSGLGSSSAVTVATIQALAATVGYELNRRQLFELSFDTVLAVQHGRGSGFDVASATYGGTVYYQNRGEVIEPLAVEPEMPLVTIYSGVKASTTQYVGRVAELYREYPRHVEQIFKNIAAIVDDARLALTGGHWETAGQLMNFNQGYLTALGVSTGHVDMLLAGVMAGGALGAKLSGAGGGDCVIGVTPYHRPFEAPHQPPYQPLEIMYEAAGARLEQYGSDGV
jgi:mevalonate kinase